MTPVGRLRRLLLRHSAGTTVLQAVLAEGYPDLSAYLGSEADAA
jgi:hypothetical protein